MRASGLRPVAQFSPSGMTAKKPEKVVQFSLVLLLKYTRFECGLRFFSTMLLIFVITVIVLLTFFDVTKAVMIDLHNLQQKEKRRRKM